MLYINNIIEEYKKSEIEINYSNIIANRGSARFVLIICFEETGSKCTRTNRANLKLLNLFQIFCFILLFDLSFLNVGFSKTIVKIAIAHLPEKMALLVIPSKCLPAFKWSKIILVFIQPFKKSFVLEYLFAIAYKASTIAKKCQEVCDGSPHVKSHVTLC